MIACPRCDHRNEHDANFCSSCGASLSGLADETTLTLSAVEAAEDEDDLAHYLDGLPAGMGLLVVRHGPNEGASYRLDNDVTTAGRHPDSDLFFDDITVSRRHVRIDRSGDEYTVRDVGSLNGTYVNHERIEQASLHSGDEVQIGRYRLSFVQGR